ncbi:MAG: hypothetical protein HOK98_11175 [Rhodospirillaceae bacterium]|jgi:hypothetical protein|nr:hypothetical protein [Rhodospirillaceae bacterium]MBT5944759.1 hypothetical protein [Rhodospirillaceae bacterium]MBT6405230.1 hypothetical protein [Rhodospirillaceae bacterium]MBT6536734.1 hypothetical protein [Rhodospirillaceae bacterium]MBT7361286.1 hypothetical protein [Rhodospirillaceae bacterium]
MPSPLIETSSQYRELCERITALESHLTAINAVRVLAHSNRDAARIEAVDLRDLLPLDDARSDITYTLRGLEQAASEWEARRYARRLSTRP